jgi:hypothetical protein
VVPKYLSRMPASVPPGSILVHNHLQPARRLGWRGFRAWLDTLDAPGRAPVEPCPCGWASELGQHYRVKARWQPGADTSDTANEI